MISKILYERIPTGHYKEIWLFDRTEFPLEIEPIYSPIINNSCQRIKVFLGCNILLVCVIFCSRLTSTTRIMVN